MREEAGIETKDFDVILRTLKDGWPIAELDRVRSEIYPAGDKAGLYQGGDK